MQARGPLMIEHRLIERMLARVKEALARIRATGRVDPLFVDAAVDFIRMYADRTHHGKEEDILFRELKRRKLAGHDRQVMEELIQEHVFGRQTTRELVAANTRYRNGDPAALADIERCLQTLVEFYPQHIAKEDQVFFPAVRACFTEAEEQAILAEFQEFDRNMIHEKYRAVVAELEKAN